ncbi:hypothetical protein ACFE04_017614 [Oxalis oulophora]
MDSEPEPAVAPPPHIEEQDANEMMDDDDDDATLKKYMRGEPANLEVLKDKKLKTRLSIREEYYGKSAKTAAKADKFLNPSEGGYLETEGLEKSWRIKQEDLRPQLHISSAKNQYDIVLPDLGPYTIDFTANGRYMAAAGRKGHLAIVDMMSLNLYKEFQVGETVRDVAILENEQMFVAAQKKYTYIYNWKGTELHCLKVSLHPCTFTHLKEHGPVLRLQYLKKHFLIATINKFGQLHYQDPTTGEIVGNIRSSLGRCDVMKVNPYNGVTGLGHTGGTVTMWKPTMASPLVKMLCHHGPISSLAFHPNGQLMATSGVDSKIKIWDLRKFEVLQTFSGHAKTLDFSQKGLLAMGMGSTVQISQDFSNSRSYSRYMSHHMVKGYQIGNVRFRPYEDILGIGHSMGWSSIIIPGSGEPNFDTHVANPFQTNKQRREKEVQDLLVKLPPESIMLDPSKVGTMQQVVKKERRKKKDLEDELEDAVENAKSVKMKRKTKGRSKPSKIASKKDELVAKAKRPFLEQDMKEREDLSKKKPKLSHEVELPAALQRFARKEAA